MTVRLETERMIGVFGWRETELAAIRILDAQWDRPFEPVDPAIFNGAVDRDGLAAEGFRELKLTRLVDERNVPTRAFWMRVHGR